MRRQKGEDEEEHRFDGADCWRTTAPRAAAAAPVALGTARGERRGCLRRRGSGGGATAAAAALAAAADARSILMLCVFERLAFHFSFLSIVDLSLSFPPRCSQNAPLPLARRGGQHKITSLPTRGRRDRDEGDELSFRDERIDIFFFFFFVVPDLDLLLSSSDPSQARPHRPLLPGRRRAGPGPHRRLRRDLV